MDKARLTQFSVDELLRPKGHPRLSFAIRTLVVLFGCLVAAIGVNSFLAPARILPGGLTGIAQLLHYGLHLPIGTLYFLMNIPLFLLGYRSLGRRFIALSGIGITGFSLFTDLVRPHFNVPTNDPLLISLYGGVLMGISSGLVLRSGGSAGGIDILSLVIHRTTGKSVGSVSFALNVVVVLLSMSVFGLQAGLYSLVSMFATARVVNALLHHQHRKTALIVSARANAIAEAIGQRLGRGSTLMNASGSYTQNQLGVLMCALTHLELAELKSLCLAIDPNVFITVLDTTEVVGRFRQVAD